MNKRRLIISLWSSVIFVSLAGGLLASVAWFVSSNDLKVDVTGSVVEEYFHCGKGTVDDPFVITRPIHYYHLVEFFQRETTLPLSNSPHFGSDYLYFQVGYDLDDDGDLEVYSYDDQGIYQGTFASPVYSNTLNMAYYSGTNALMPIGTNEVPFIGSFDGKASDGISISNINIHCSETVLKGNQSITRTASDIGVFGYVADSVNSTATVIKNARFNGVNIDLTNVAATVASSTTGVQHVNAHDNNTAYVGYIAGHVHTYTNYVAGNPATNASPLYDVYVNNATVQGGPGTVCNYGYIGLVDTIDGEESADISGIVEELGQGPGGGQGQGDDWGGSINMHALNARFYQLANSGSMSYFRTGTSNRYFAYTENDERKITFGRGDRIDTYLAKNPETNMVIYNLMGDGTHYANSSYYADMPGTAIPLSFDNNGNTAENNTGYIISNTRDETSGTYSGKKRFNASVRSGSYYISHIANSISDTAVTPVDAYPDLASGNTFTGRYNSATTEILTNKGASYTANGSGSTNYVLIKDSYNASHTPANSYLTSYTKNDTTDAVDGLKLQKYAKARASLGEVLNGATYIQGIHFMDDQIAYNKTISLNTVKLNGQTYNNYALPKSCIDFNLKEHGLINFFGGSYYNLSSAKGSIADCFFSLSVVERSGTTLTSNSIKEISYVYKNNAFDKTDPDSKQYIYRYSDNKYSDTGTTTKSSDCGDLVFDMRFITEQPPVANALYYFEIPVNKGEYALGGVDGHDAGGYLMYLDIGASAGEEEEPTFNQENIISDSPLFTQIGFLSSTDSFFFNSCFNVAYVIPTGSDKDKFSITISCGTETVDGNPYTCYDIAIVNTSGNNFIISALLIDDDDIDDENYFYMYAITYNGGTRTTYHSSNTYTGASGATSMTPTYS